MKEIIKSIFELNGFQSKDLEDFRIYYQNENSKKREYWVVVDAEADEVLKRQAAIAEICRKNISADDLDKNSSLLILDRVDSQEEKITKSLNAISIEEDPYHFKKYCLIYADTEVKELENRVIKDNINTFLTKIILDPNCFSQYKSDPKKLCWQSLVYRLANKLPFIKIKVATNKGLTPLFESNLAKIRERNLEKLNSIVQDPILDLTRDNMANFSGAEIMKFFDPIMLNNDEDK